MDKAALRKSLLQTRQALSAQVWQEKSLAICRHLQASALFDQAQTILSYFSVRQEPDLSSLFHLGKQWGLSRCVDKALVWHAWSPQAELPLQVGKYGIQEPHPNAPAIAPKHVDLILVPALACDQQGYRLGYGGGYYDRLLSQPQWQPVPTIGIVFEHARLPQLPVDPWDQPLRAVCTEEGVFTVSGL
jgi:5-formyltetrahydrofolate cyclo-ligase